MPTEDSRQTGDARPTPTPGRNGGDPNAYDQAARPLELVTKLPRNSLLLVGLRGTEALSRLFRYELDLVAPDTATIPFDRLMGQPVAIRITNHIGRSRFIHGHCARFTQGGRDVSFRRYGMTVVPHLWFLTLRARSRIFQQIAVPDILRKVLQAYGFDVEYGGLKAHYEPRDYCVQYRESDFQFLSRLMEEEGIYYYFRHEQGGHVLVLTDGPHGLLELPQEAIYEELEGNHRPEDRVYDWQKTQEVCPGRVTLWDHTFEIAHDHLAAEATLRPNLHAGQVEHKLAIPRNEQLEIYDYPGEYAQRFDGIDPMGGERPAELKKIAPDSQRAARLRMEELQATALAIEGASTRADFLPGGVVQLKRHFDADGRYLLTEVRHSARLDSHYRADDAPSEWSYDNTFACIPAEASFRPARQTPKSVVQGPQTAVVTGPHDEEIFTDKHGRVKVQFHWDREAQGDALTSCWVRVAQFAAGGNWGAQFLPRVGQEVVVTFEEGDPDRPLVTGCVYNDKLRPPFKLPEQRMLSGYRSNSYKGGGGSNEFSVDDTKGKELMYLHAQYDQKTEVGHDRTTVVGNDCDESVVHNKTESVGVDKKVTVGGNESTTIGSNQTLMVAANQTESVGSNKTANVALASAETVGAAKALSIGAAYQVSVGGAMNETVGAMKAVEVAGDSVEIVAKNKKVQVVSDMDQSVGGKFVAKSNEATVTGLTKITLMCGASMIEMTPATITIKAPMVKINC